MRSLFDYLRLKELLLFAPQVEHDPNVRQGINKILYTSQVQDHGVNKS